MAQVTRGETLGDGEGGEVVEGDGEPVEEDEAQQGHIVSDHHETIDSVLVAAVIRT